MRRQLQSPASPRSPSPSEYGRQAASRMQADTAFGEPAPSSVHMPFRRRSGAAVDFTSPPTQQQEQPQPEDSTSMMTRQDLATMGQLQQLRVAVGDAQIDMDTLLTESTHVLPRLHLAATRAMYGRSPPGRSPPGRGDHDGMLPPLRSSWLSQAMNPSKEGLVEIGSCISCEDPDALDANCGHRYCVECLNNMLKVIMEDRSASKFPPRCCGMLLVPKPVWEAVLRPDHLVMYHEKLEEMATPNRIYCAAVDCGNWVKPTSIFNSLGTCSKCAAITCVLCRNLGPHEASTCPEDKGQEQVLNLAKKQKWMRCNQCQSVVELAAGCNHMRCRCGFQFCYSCGAAWKTCHCQQFDRHNTHEGYRRMLMERRNALGNPLGRQEDGPPDAVGLEEGAETRGPRGRPNWDAFTGEGTGPDGEALLAHARQPDLPAQPGYNGPRLHDLHPIAPWFTNPSYFPLHDPTLPAPNPNVSTALNFNQELNRMRTIEQRLEKIEARNRVESSWHTQLEGSTTHQIHRFPRDPNSSLRPRHQELAGMLERDLSRAEPDSPPNPNQRASRQGNGERPTEGACSHPSWTSSAARLTGARMFCINCGGDAAFRWCGDCGARACGTCVGKNLV